MANGQTDAKLNGYSFPVELRVTGGDVQDGLDDGFMVCDANGCGLIKLPTNDLEFAKTFVTWLNIAYNTGKKDAKLSVHYKWMAFLEEMKDFTR